MKTKKQRLLVSFSDNWADEMDLAGFLVTTEELWENYKEQAITVFDHHKETGLEIYFGINESQIYDDYDEFINKFTVKKIDEQAFEMLKKLFPGCDSFGFGNFAFIDSYYDNVVEEKKYHGNL